MSAAAIVWLIIAIAVIVVLVLAAVQALRAVREAQRLKQRVEAYANLPLFGALSTFERDAARLNVTMKSAEPLIERAQVAIAVIRRGPLPPEVTGAYRRVRDELVAIRRLRGG